MRRTRSTVTAAAALAVAAVTAVWAGVALATAEGDDPPREFGVSAQKDVASDRLNAPDPVQPKTTRETPAPALPPRQVQVPAIGVRAPVVPTGVTRAGNAEIPRDGDVVGWYEYGSTPGDRRGSAVLIGHRDTEAEGPGALFDLDALQPGDTIEVAVGRKQESYQVVALRSINKDGLPDSLFRRGGPHQLVVITCGGAFIPEAGGYQENLFAVAVPVDR